MANEIPTASVYYDGDGSTTSFSVPFSYIDQAYVFVEVSGVPVDFSWTTEDTVTLATAPAVGTDNVHVYRSTLSSSMLAVFSDDTPFLAKYIDKDNTQLLNLIQEINSGSADLVAEEAAARIAADNALGVRVTAETARAQAAEAAVDARIDKELSDILAGTTIQSVNGDISIDKYITDADIVATDHTALIQSAIDLAAAANKRLVFDGRRISTFYVTPRSIALRDGSKVWCAGNVVFNVSDSTNETNYALQGSGVSNVVWEGGTFVGVSSRTVALSFVGSSVNIKVLGVRSQNARVVVFGAGLPYATAVLGTNNCRVLEVRGCYAVCSNVVTANSYACIDMRYAQYARISDNHVDGYRHGISWWGGNGAVTNNGAADNERKCTHITISGNVVLNTRGGGIWGSMGRYVTVTGNVVDTSADVGIDFEASYDWVGGNNVVRNCRYGALANFGITRNGMFIGNAVETNVYNNIMYKTEFSGTVGDNSDVAVIDNSFRCNDSTNWGYAVRSNGPINRFTFRGNRLYNCTIGYEPTLSNNALYNYVDISDNDVVLDYSSQASTSPTVLQARYFYALGSNTVQCRIRGNRLVTRNAPSGFSAVGILVVQNQSDYSFVAEIKDNFIDMVTSGIEINLVDQGTSSSITAVFNIDGNVLRYGRLVRSDNGSTVVKVNIGLNNVSRAINWATWPGSVPSSTNHPAGSAIKWDVGQVIKLVDLSSGYTHAVCTTSGVDGTAVWKYTGALVAIR